MFTVYFSGPSGYSTTKNNSACEWCTSGFPNDTHIRGHFITFWIPSSVSMLCELRLQGHTLSHLSPLYWWKNKRQGLEQVCTVNKQRCQVIRLFEKWCESMSRNRDFFFEKSERNQTLPVTSYILNLMFPFSNSVWY